MDTFLLTLVRHGETAENQLKIIQGQTDTKLTQIGKEQVVLLGKFLKNEKFTHVYTSDLNRAYHTCEIIVKLNEANANHISTDPRLRERKLGVLEGQFHSDCQRLIRNKRRPFSEYGMESKRQVRERAKSFFKDICKIVSSRKKINITKSTTPLTAITGAATKLQKTDNSLNNSSNINITSTNNNNNQKQTFINDFCNAINKDDVSDINSRSINCSCNKLKDNSTNKNLHKQHISNFSETSNFAKSFFLSNANLNDNNVNNYNNDSDNNNNLNGMDIGINSGNLKISTTTKLAELKEHCIEDNNNNFPISNSGQPTTCDISATIFSNNCINDGGVSNKLGLGKVSSPSFCSRVDRAIEKGRHSLHSFSTTITSMSAKTTKLSTMSTKTTTTASSTTKTSATTSLETVKLIKCNSVELDNNDDDDDVSMNNDVNDKNNNYTLDENISSDNANSNNNNEHSGTVEDCVANILIVSHGGFLMELITYFFKELKCENLDASAFEMQSSTTSTTAAKLTSTTDMTVLKKSGISTTTVSMNTNTNSSTAATNPLRAGTCTFENIRSYSSTACTTAFNTATAAATTAAGGFGADDDQKSSVQTAVFSSVNDLCSDAAVDDVSEYDESTTMTQDQNRFVADIINDHPASNNQAGSVDIQDNDNRMDCSGRGNHNDELRSECGSVGTLSTPNHPACPDVGGDADAPYLPERDSSDKRNYNDTDDDDEINKKKKNLSAESSFESEETSCRRSIMSNAGISKFLVTINRKSGKALKIRCLYLNNVDHLQNEAIMVDKNSNGDDGGMVGVVSDGDGNGIHTSAAGFNPKLNKKVVVRDGVCYYDDDDGMGCHSNDDESGRSNDDDVDGGGKNDDDAHDVVGR